MAATVVHFGTNDCNRVLVLRSAGYLVDDCPSINEFRSVLERDTRPDALLFSEKRPAERVDAVVLARSRFSQTPLILFEDLNGSEDEQNFDLVIHPLTAPAVWLQEVAATIERTRALQADSIVIREQSALLVQQSEILRQKSVTERERSARQRQAAEKTILEFRKWPKTPDKT